MTSRAISSVMVMAELRAADVMTTDPIVVASHESLAAAWEVLARTGCGFLPVVRRGRVVGVIDERTLVRAHARGQADGGAGTITEAASPAHTVHSATPLPELVARFAAEDTRALVVVDSDGRVLGVVTSSTLVSLLSAALHLTTGRGTLPATR
jgi:CBS domain-containing protein